VHLGLHFPGGSIPDQDPFDDRLAWVTLRSLEQAGAFVVFVHYDDGVLGQDQARFKSGVGRELRSALVHHEPTRLTIVGKSRGTFVLRIACTEEATFPDSDGVEARFVDVVPGVRLVQAVDFVSEDLSPTPAR
jgi:hypothetical protein